MNACQQQELLLDYVYEELSPAQADALTEHLQGCARCSQELAGLKGVRGAMAALPPAELPEDAVSRMTAELMSAASAEAARLAAAAEQPLGAELLRGASAARGEQEGGKVLPLRRRGVMRVLMHPASGVLAAAALALVVVAANGWQKTLRPALLPPPAVIHEDDDEPARPASSAPAAPAATPAPAVAPPEAPARDRNSDGKPLAQTVAEKNEERAAADKAKADVANLDELAGRPAPMASLKKGAAPRPPDAVAERPVLLKDKESRSSRYDQLGERSAAFEGAASPPAPGKLAPPPVEAKAAAPAKPQAPAPRGGLDDSGDVSPSDDAEVRRGQDVLRAASAQQRRAELDHVMKSRALAKPEEAPARQEAPPPPPSAPPAAAQHYSQNAPAPQAGGAPAAEPTEPAQAAKEAPEVANGMRNSQQAPLRSYGAMGRGPGVPQTMNQASQGLSHASGGGLSTRAALSAALREHIQKGHCAEAAATAVQIERQFGSLADDERQTLQQSACARAGDAQLAEPNAAPGNYQEFNRRNRAAPARKATKSKAAEPAL